MQLKIDFSQTQHDDGKKISRIPTAVSEELKSFVDLMAKKQRLSVSELTHRYIVEGLRNDVANLFMPEPHLDKSLREIMGKFR